MELKDAITTRESKNPPQGFYAPKVGFVLLTRRDNPIQAIRIAECLPHSVFLL